MKEISSNIMTVQRAGRLVKGLELYIMKYDSGVSIGNYSVNQRYLERGTCLSVN